MSGSFKFDVVWRGLEMIENKQKNVVICSYKLYKHNLLIFIYEFLYLEYVLNKS